MNKVRVRFAPSPTGYLNLGGARSALFNWLFARNKFGTFLLRIEDTDRARLVEGSQQQIKEGLKWLKIEPDEAPLKQSSRLALYRQKADELVKRGSLYPCWCSPERLAKLRHEAQANGIPFKYDRHCLAHPKELSQPHVLRFKVPETPAEISWSDEVKGKISVGTDTLDDFVALKSDGYPTYHFASVVDDHEMKISHVLRADEWVASTPKHLLLYQAFNWQPPVFAHLPAVLGTDGTKKLSKRHGARPVLEYRDDGYLPEALINFLALLGWNPGEGSTKEIFSLEELTKEFSLAHIQKSPAVFDPARLDWLNGVYIRGLPIGELAGRAEPFWPKEAKKYPKEYRERVLALFQERLKFLGELGELSGFFFSEPAVSLGEPKERAEELREKSLEVLEQSDFTADDLEKRLRQLAEKLEVKTGVLFGFLRLGVTGTAVAPPLFDTLAVLGKNTVLKRIKNLQV